MQSPPWFGFATIIADFSARSNGSGVEKGSCAHGLAREDIGTDTQQSRNGTFLYKITKSKIRKNTHQKLKIFPS